MAGLPISQLEVGETYKFIKNFLPGLDDSIGYLENGVWVDAPASQTKAKPAVEAGEVCTVTEVHNSANPRSSEFTCTWRRGGVLWKLTTSSEILGAVGGGRRKNKKSRKSRKARKTRKSRRN
jgi:hypothetical protein